MLAEFWHDRWQQGQIGFHQTSTNKYLEKYWLQILANRQTTDENSRVFVPLCGKSNDMHWLARQGHQVLGVELSDFAVETFFAEAAERKSMQVKKRFRQPWIDYETAQIKIKVGDFFQLNAEHVENCSLIYDRAALIALPPEMRRDYAEKINQLFPQATILLITMTYDQSRYDGPPFSLSDEEIAQLFPLRQKTLLERNNELAKDPRWRERQVDTVHESIYHLTAQKIV